MLTPTTYEIRLAGDADEAALERLAQLHSAEPLEHPILVGELEGRVVAALDLDTERAIADPFVPTASVVSHLRARAAAFDAASRTPDVADRVRAAMRRTRIAHA